MAPQMIDNVESVRQGYMTTDNTRLDRTNI